MKIIGGPMLRRVEPTRAYIWIALDQAPSSLNALIKLENGKKVSTADTTSLNTHKFGQKIYIALIKLTPSTQSGKFPFSRKLYYDILIDGKSLVDFKPSEFTFTGEKLPSFFVPEKHQNILQGSCRKPHAGDKNKVNRDQMAKAADIVKASLNDLSSRPSLMYLTGDQIYADDVATPLLAVIMKKTHEYLGWDEVMPEGVTPAKLDLYSRDQELTWGHGFTSTHRHNHLMSFGEYLMMYLIVWGGIKVKLPSYKDVADNIAPDPDDEFSTIISKGDYEKERSRVTQFFKSTNKVRRLLANVPSYMMFDDHEITDDWNLTRDIQNKQNNKPLSRRVVGNGLAAYFVCQGWGNDPDNFPQTFVRNVTRHLNAQNETHATAYENVLLKHYWGYVVDGYPATIALDTRTKRSFANGNRPELMDFRTLKSVTSQLIGIATKYAGEEDAQTVMFLSPAPVYGFKSIEMIQMLFNEDLADKVDAETWMGNKTARENLQKVFTNLFTKHCLIISGDVHYAYNRIEKHRSSDEYEGRTFYQLTSSSMCNAPGSFGHKGLKMLSRLSRSKLMAFNREHSHYLWPKESRTDFLTGHTNVGLIRFDAGLPISYTLYCHDNEKGKAFQWNYDLQNPNIVHFS